MSAKGKEYELAIRISGMVDKSFDTALVKTNAELAKQQIAFGNQMQIINKDFMAMDKGFDSIMKVGKTCFKAIASAAGIAAVAVGAVAIAATNAGSEFESAFAGVKKTVDATEQEYARLRQDILDMSEVIPESAVDIAAVMEIAGQLGIATDSLSDFTETMIKLGTSTNLSAEDAATALSRFANVTNMANYDKEGVSNYERLGSVIVDLGNNFATTEEEIVTMATNLAATGDMVGLSQAQIMGLATAMSSTGIKAEKGGTAMSKLLRRMQLAVETNGSTLKDYASVSNMSVGEFTKAFKTDAVGALSAFIDGLNDTERNGKSAVAVLTDMKLGEVRLSDVILRLANANGILSESLQTANKAWGENTALTIEANKRYETFESKVDLLKNSFKTMLIKIYDEITRSPVMEWVGSLTDKIKDFTKNGISGLANKVNTTIPTIGRKFKSAWKMVEPFAKGLWNFGGWLVDNGSYVAAALIGIGSAMATYKIASEIVHIVTALTSLSANPVTVGIMAIVAAIGAVTTAIMEYKAYRQELVDESLAEHFGNIALSMKDIRRVAESLVNTKALDGVRKALSAFGESDEVLQEIARNVEDIELLNWKVNIGLELSEDEKEAYKTTITDYVAGMNDWIIKEGYAVQLNLSAALGDDSVVGAKVNNYYQASIVEMEKLGKELADYVNDAFSDGVLDVDEIEVVQKLQEKMAYIQAQLATSEMDANIFKLGKKYAGAALDSESYQNLTSEINEVYNNALEEIYESFGRSATIADNSHKAGVLTDFEYSKTMENLERDLQTKIADLASKAADFELETLGQLYGGEMANVFNKVMSDEFLSGINLDEMENGRIEETITGLIANDVDFRTVRDSISQLIAPVEQLIESMRLKGDELSGEQKKIVDRYDEWIAQINWDTTSKHLWTAVGRSIANSDASDIFSYVFDVAKNKNPEMIPAGLYDGIYESVNKSTTETVSKIKEGTIKPAVNSTYEYCKNIIDDSYKKGFDVSSEIRVKLNPTLSSLPSFSQSMSGLPINHRAKGGLATSPELTWFAEEGPEMAIPMDGSKNAISLWEKAGRLLGMGSTLDKYNVSGGGSRAEVTYSPTLQFYGDAPSKQELQDALNISQDKFDAMMDRYFKRNKRVSFE